MTRKQLKLVKRIRKVCKKNWNVLIKLRTKYKKYIKSHNLIDDDIVLQESDLHVIDKDVESFFFYRSLIELIIKLDALISTNMEIENVKIIMMYQNWRLLKFRHINIINDIKLERNLVKKI